VTPRDTSLDDLLEFVKASRGFDFTGYKRASVERRVRKRMGELDIDELDAYIEYLELNGDEFVELFNTLLINVTSFFRDPDIWSHLADDVLPQLLAGAAPDRPLRVWCAGCASGEEAYTVAMVLARALGDDAFRERVKIYATDIDEPALDEARHGAYLPRQLEHLDAATVDRFFERSDQRFVFRKDLRRCVIFGRNDLIQDAPISRIDLLVCRNTLMYFTADTQAQILRRFHFALADDGAMMLGKSEMIITHAELFTPIDLRSRIFRKVLRPTLRDRVRVLAVDPGDGASLGVAENLREAAYDASPNAQIVLDAERSLVMANAAARRLFKLGPADLGRPVQDLELSYRPLELRGHLDALEREPRTLDVGPVRLEGVGQPRIFEVRLIPLLGDGQWLGATVVYEDQTDLVAIRSEMTTTRRELEQTYEELQSTVEELETTNEELQSTNEELETTNEELQSTNEELETMNEELQSTNEELETMNDELRHRTLELNDMNAFLETILTTIGIAVAVLDRRQEVQIWNSQARELWGLSADEVSDQNWFGLDIGLPVERLRGAIRACLVGSAEREEIVLDAVNRRGQAFRCQVVVLPMRTGQGPEPSGTILLMESAEE
jgi:two-component system, chemotaxis family, CheB/CheR fusion protein